MNFYQIFLLVFTLVFLLQVFLIRSYVQWKRTGINPFVFGDSDSALDYVGLVYKTMIGVTWGSIIMFAFLPDHYQYLLPFWYLEYDTFKIMGTILATASFIWIILSQYHMSNSWRIGINFSEETKLITSGVFCYSRNPMFLGVLVCYLGNFLIAPNAFTLLVLIVTYVVLQVQIRLEEEYLQGIHKSEYTKYKAKVRRWL